MQNKLLTLSLLLFIFSSCSDNCEVIPPNEETEESFRFLASHNAHIDEDVYPFTVIADESNRADSIIFMVIPVDSDPEVERPNLEYLVPDIQCKCDKIEYRRIPHFSKGDVNVSTYEFTDYLAGVPLDFRYPEMIQFRSTQEGETFIYTVIVEFSDPISVFVERDVELLDYLTEGITIERWVKRFTNIGNSPIMTMFSDVIVDTENPVIQDAELRGDFGAAQEPRINGDFTVFYKHSLNPGFYSESVVFDITYDYMNGLIIQKNESNPYTIDIYPNDYAFNVETMIFQPADKAGN